MKRWITMVIALIACAVQATSLENLTWQQAQQRLSEGSITSQQLVTYYVQRIQSVDAQPNGVNAVSQLNPNALNEAIALDKARAAGQVRGPLHGLPVLVKDNIDIAGGMTNSAGSVALAQNFPADDAFVIRQLREAGAIILGKTNLSEWANFRSTRSSSGWSSLFGQTRNPHDLTRSPCGSSSGSGAAIAADFSLLAIGTETDGSVTCPASVNGIVGFKPTLGLVSRDGIIPIAHSQDTAGPMARSVAGVVALLQAMVAVDNKDPQAVQGQTDYLQHLKLDGLKGKRIGVVRQLTGYHEQLDDVFDAQLAILRQQGAIIVDNVELANYAQWNPLEYQILVQEFSVDLPAYLATTGEGVPKTLQAIIEYNQANAGTAMPYFGQEILQAALQPPMSHEDYLEQLSELKKLATEQGIDAAMQAHQLDVLIAPSNQPAWKIDWVNGDNYKGAASSPAAIAGYPHISVPMGFVQDLPVGLSFFAGKLQEGVLIEAAYAYEQATQARRAPNLRQ